PSRTRQRTHEYRRNHVSHAWGFLSGLLVDSNVILDVLTQDRNWFEWSSGALADAAQATTPCINPIIYAEVSIRFKQIEDLEAALPTSMFRRLSLPWEAAFLAGKCFVKYRKAG